MRGLSVQTFFAEKNVPYFNLFNHQSMFTSHNDFHKNGHQRNVDSFGSVHYGPKLHYLFNPHRNASRMEFKLWLAITYGLGLTSYVGAILLNIGNWKSDVLFMFAVIFAMTRFIFFCVKQVQLKQLRDIEIKREKREYDRDIFS